MGEGVAENSNDEFSAEKSSFQGVLAHVRTAPYYPQSNGKLERWHGSLKQECIRPKIPLSLPDALRIVAIYVRYYNHERLHSAIEYTTPMDMQTGKTDLVMQRRKQKLFEARMRRQRNRQNYDKTQQPEPETIVSS